MKPLLVSIFSIIAFGLSAQGVTITYIANEGVLIQSDDKKVMIDALFDDYYEDYLSPDEAARKQMITGKSPFQKVDVVLTTHFHRDHFEAKITGDFMSDHDESRFLSSNQVRDELKSKFDGYTNISGRLIAKTRDVQTYEDVVNRVKIKSFFINHAGGERNASIENMGFIIELGGKKILHLGDSDMDIERFKAVNLSQYDIDVALIPYWYMIDDMGTEIINEHIKAKSLIGIHFPKVGSPTALEGVKQAFPGATVFQKAMQNLKFN